MECVARKENASSRRKRTSTWAMETGIAENGRCGMWLGVVGSFNLFLWSSDSPPLIWV